MLLDTTVHIVGPTVKVRALQNTNNAVNQTWYTDLLSGTVLVTAETPSTNLVR